MLSHKQTKNFVFNCSERILKNHFYEFLLLRFQFSCFFDIHQENEAAKEKLKIFDFEQWKKKFFSSFRWISSRRMKCGTRNANLETVLRWHFTEFSHRQRHENLSRKKEKQANWHLRVSVKFNDPRWKPFLALFLRHLNGIIRKIKINSGEQTYSHWGQTKSISVFTSLFH